MRHGKYPLHRGLPGAAARAVRGLRDLALRTDDRDTRSPTGAGSATRPSSSGLENYAAAPARTTCSCRPSGTTCSSCSPCRSSPSCWPCSSRSCSTWAGAGTGPASGACAAPASTRSIFFFPQVLSLAIIAVMWQELYRSDESGLLNGVRIADRAGRREQAVAVRRRPDAVPRRAGGAVVAAARRGLGRRRLLHGAVLGRHAVDPEGHLRGGDARRREPGRTRSSGSRCRCCATRVSVAWVYLGFLALDMYVLVYVLTPQQGGPNHASEVFGTVMLLRARSTTASSATPARWVSRWPSSRSSSPRLQLRVTPPRADRVLRSPMTTAFDTASTPAVTTGAPRSAPFAAGPATASAAPACSTSSRTASCCCGARWSSCRCCGRWRRRSRPTREISRDPLGLPTGLHWENFGRAWTKATSATSSSTP